VKTPPAAAPRPRRHGGLAAHATGTPQPRRAASSATAAYVAAFRAGEGPGRTPAAAASPQYDPFGITTGYRPGGHVSGPACEPSTLGTGLAVEDAGGAGAGLALVVKPDNCCGCDAGDATGAGLPNPVTNPAEDAEAARLGAASVEPFFPGLTFRLTFSRAFEPVTACRTGAATT
jgi:hypothetical protein